MQIQTAGQLREFLCMQLLGIKNGDVEINKASAITKMAEQITNSLYSEMKMKQLQLAAGENYAKIGSMALGDNSNIIEGN